MCPPPAPLLQQNEEPEAPRFFLLSVTRPLQRFCSIFSRHGKETIPKKHESAAQKDPVCEMRAEMQREGMGLASMMLRRVPGLLAQLVCVASVASSIAASVWQWRLVPRLRRHGNFLQVEQRFECKPKTPCGALRMRP